MKSLFIFEGKAGIPFYKHGIHSFEKKQIALNFNLKGFLDQCTM